MPATLDEDIVPGRIENDQAVSGVAGVYRDQFAGSERGELHVWLRQLYPGRASSRVGNFERPLWAACDCGGLPEASQLALQHRLSSCHFFGKARGLTIDSGRS
jgi:hypothetical protein